MILDKMWAKIHGNYDITSGGLTGETVFDLCGAPGITFKPPYSANEAW